MNFSIQVLMLIFVSTMIMVAMSAYMVRLHRRAPLIFTSWIGFLLILAIGVYGLSSFEKNHRSVFVQNRLPGEVSQDFPEEKRGATPIAYQHSYTESAQPRSGFWPLLFLQATLLLFFLVIAFISLYGDSLDRSRLHTVQLEDSIRNWMKAKNEAKKAKQTKDNFLMNISHEIRTPLNAILGLSQILDLKTREFTAPQHQQSNREIVEIIRQNGEDLTTMIDDLLLYSSIDSSDIEVRLNSFDIRNLLEEIHRELQNRFRIPDQTRSIDSKVEYLEPFPVEMVSDRPHLKTILRHLWENAIKFHRSDPAKVHVRCRIGEIGRCEDLMIQWERKKWENGPWNEFSPAVFSVEVIDSGIGISPEHLEKVFHPFHQVDSSTTREYGGLGLGLTLARRLARILDGDVFLESNKEKGTRAVLRLPCLVLG